MSVYHFSYAYTITEVRNSEMKSEKLQEHYNRRDCFISYICYFRKEKVLILKTLTLRSD